VPTPRDLPVSSATRLIRCCALAGALCLCSAAAQAGVTVGAPWVRPTPERTATDAYMVLTSTEGALLKEARSILATSVVIRGATGVKTYPQLALPAGVPVVLASDQFHLVLRGLAHPLSPGDRVPLVLTIETATGARQEISLTAEVRARPPADDERRAPKR
jgi:copper(I)-binding protein